MAVISCKGYRRRRGFVGIGLGLGLGLLPFGELDFPFRCEYNCIPKLVMSPFALSSEEEILLLTHSTPWYFRPDEVGKHLDDDGLVRGDPHSLCCLMPTQG